MKDRIKQIRKKIGLTQTSFGEKIGVKGNTITNYETGLRSPTEAVMLSICRTFDVNEEWLKHGTGEMFIEKTKDEQISEMLADVQNMEDSKFKRRLVSALAKMTDEEWDLLEKIIDYIAEEKAKQKKEKE